MIPSSSSGASHYASSSPSLRPPSNISHRPPSSASNRPPSSLSSRPLSSASIRSNSRITHRPSSRHARSRLLPLYQTLVTQITGLSAGGDDDENFAIAVEFVSKNLEATTLNKGAVSVDMHIMDRQIHGHSQKARINSRDILAEALETSYQHLKAQVANGSDLDQEIKVSRFPDHLQLLISLSLPPTPQTLTYAELYLHDLHHPVAPPPPLTWQTILAEEPFSGQHWDGVYGLPPGSVIREDIDDSRSPGSSPSLSPIDSDDSFSSADYDGEARGLEARDEFLGSPEEACSTPPYTYAHRKVFEDLQKKQYWRPEWRTDADVGREFDIGIPSTLGPTLRRVLGTLKNQSRSNRLELLIDGPEQERYIDEFDAVREILIGLQGRQNLLLQSSADGVFIPIPTAPRLIHYSLTSQGSVLASFVSIASIIHQLRAFTASTFARSLNPQNSAASNRPGRPTRTLEAFADAVDHELRTFDMWCAQREEAMCAGGDGNIVSLLSTEKAVRDGFEAPFEALLVVMRRILSSEDERRLQGYREPRPAEATARLLDALFEAVCGLAERDNREAAEVLMRVFMRSAEPVWAMVGQWLRDGMGMGIGVEGYEGGGRGFGYIASELDEEFFIEANGLGVAMGVGLLDPDFWAEGYALRGGGSGNGEEDKVTGRERTKMIPVFLENVAEPVLGCGKAVGLLRALGVPLGVISGNSDGDVPADEPWLATWRPFEALLAAEAGRQASAGLLEVTHDDHREHKEEITQYLASANTLSRLVYDELQPYCQATGVRIAKVLVEDCDLFKHLHAIEGLFLMRRGDAMSHFADVLFAKMDTQQPWSDFHFLNTAFSDIVEASAGATAGGKEWVQASLVRLSFRGNKDKDKTIHRTVRALDGLLVEYTVPFPLTYVFTPSVVRGYGALLVYLLQIRRAKSILERILVRGVQLGGAQGTEMKVFYAMRGRLSWFTNTLLNFLTTYVIHTQVVKFHKAFKEAKSLDEMIQIHSDHLDKIQSRCLLQTNTSALHRAILSILDICLHFSELFVAFAGDTTHNISRHSVSMKRHRSRRQRGIRRNVIGFSQSMRESLNSSDDDSDGEEENDLTEPSFSIAATSVSSSVEGGFFSQVNKMSAELDGLVRFVRRGVESLAGGVGEAAPAFGVLAFALEDWDM